MFKIQLILVIIFLSNNILLSDTWGTPKSKYEYISDNQIYKFIIKTNRNSEGKCLGILKKERFLFDKTIWKGNLINKICPLKAMVTNNGKYVVTFDDWYSVGKYPIVIYDKNGNLVKEHSLETLGLKKYVIGLPFFVDGVLKFQEDGFIEKSVSSMYWRKNSLIFFNKLQTNLFIRLHWGLIIVIKLDSGEILNKEDYLEDKVFIENKIFEYTENLLNSTDDYDLNKGALIAGQEGYKEFIPKLEKLLMNNAHNQVIPGGENPEQPYNFYFVRATAIEALKKLNIQVTNVVIKEVIK